MEKQTIPTAVDGIYAKNEYIYYVHNRLNLDPEQDAMQRLDLYVN